MNPYSNDKPLPKPFAFQPTVTAQRSTAEEIALLKKLILELRAEVDVLKAQVEELRADDSGSIYVPGYDPEENW
jgi:hypothetical protein